MTVTVNYLPPANLVYPTNPAVYVVGVPITPNVPTIGGGVVFTCTAPSLPAGLSIHPTTCVLSGTPTAAAAPRRPTPSPPRTRAGARPRPW